jgi:hypothetical protein
MQRHRRNLDRKTDEQQKERPPLHTVTPNLQIERRIGHLADFLQRQNIERVLRIGGLSDRGNLFALLFGRLTRVHYARANQLTVGQFA